MFPIAMTVSLGVSLLRYSEPNSTRNSTGSRIEKASAARSLKYPRNRACDRLRSARKFVPDRREAASATSGARVPR